MKAYEATLTIDGKRYTMASVVNISRTLAEVANVALAKLKATTDATKEIQITVKEI